MRKNFSMSFSADEITKKRIERLQKMRGTNHSKIIRDLVEDAVQGADSQILSGHAATIMFRGIVERMGADIQSDTVYPEIHLKCANLILGFPDARIEEIRGGVIPLVPEDVQRAGLNIHSREIWEIYTKHLPQLCSMILRREMHTDLRYSPLNKITDEYAGAISGVVRGFDYTRGEGGEQRTVLEVSVGRRKINVIAPTNICSDVRESGMIIYAAGVFHNRQPYLTIDAQKCVSERHVDYGSVYDMIHEWGLENKHAMDIIQMLRRIYDVHATHASELAPVFCQWCMGATKITKPGTSHILRISVEDKMDLPRNEVGLAERIKRWPEVRKRAYWTQPSW